MFIKRGAGDHHPVAMFVMLSLHGRAEGGGFFKVDGRDQLRVNFGGSNVACYDITFTQF